MRIQVASDLHLERYPDFTPQAAPEADVLVLAGDIGSYQAGSLLAARGATDFALSRFSPKAPGSPWRRVLFVPGNHEYDGLELDDTRARLRTLCEELGITWLDRELPLTTIEAGIEELVIAVADLSDLTRKARYKVETVRHDTPKLGRNDPCHCGSGKKFKACHGKA